MRFYTDIPDTVRVRWYFVDEDTPFVPYPNSFCSSVWDDLKDQYTPLGEDAAFGRTWVDGSRVGNAPAAHVCGSAEQWSRGQPAPPAAPTPVNAEGTPLCCFVGVPPPAPRVPAWWLRPEEIADLADGETIATWPAAPDSPRFGQRLGINPLTKETESGTGIVYGLFHRIPGVTPAMIAARPDAADQAGDFTTWLVFRPVGPETPTGAQLGQPINPVPNSAPSVRDGIALVDRAGQQLVYLSGLLHEWQVWSVRLAGARLSLRWNGFTVAAREDAVTGIIILSAIQVQNADPAPYFTCGIAEVVVLPFATTPEEDAEWISYFAGRYPFLGSS